MTQKPLHVIGLFTLVMINIGTIGNLGALPTLATAGAASSSFYLLAFLLYFLPYSLVCAELSTTMPTRGGVFTWVDEAFGPRWGFLAIWLQWIENIIWYPSILGYAASTFAYCFDANLANNHVYMFCMVVAIFWLCTLVNAFGMRLSGLASSIGMVTGVIFPGFLVAILGILWWKLGNPSQIQFHWKEVVPSFHHFNDIAFLVGIIMGLSGLEMSAVHGEEVKNPNQTFPRAILLAGLIVFLIAIFGSLGIARIIPADQINLASGIIQTFTVFFSQYHLAFLIPFLAFLITLGAVTNASTCLIAPTKALGEVARHGHIPAFFARHNKHRVPITILIAQGLMMTVISSIIFLMPTVSASYWIFTDLAGQLYLVMYVLLFITSIKLHYTHRHLKQGYRIPFKGIGLWTVSTIGAIGSTFCLFAGFVPPGDVQTGSLWIYEGILIGGMLLFVVAPFVIYRWSKHKQQAKAA